jgi:hypothetical protein
MTLLAEFVIDYENQNNCIDRYRLYVNWSYCDVWKQTPTFAAVPLNLSISSSPPRQVETAATDIYSETNKMCSTLRYFYCMPCSTLWSSPTSYTVFIASAPLLNADD